MHLPSYSIRLASRFYYLYQSKSINKQVFFASGSNCLIIAKNLKLNLISYSPTPTATALKLSPALGSALAFADLLEASTGSRPTPTLAVVLLWLQHFAHLSYFTCFTPPNSYFTCFMFTYPKRPLLQLLNFIYSCFDSAYYFIVPFLLLCYWHRWPWHSHFGLPIKR